MNEMQAIQRLKKGDISGLEILIAHYQVKAVRTAFLITHDAAMAEDVVQDTFLRIYQRIRHYDDTRPFGPYLMCSVAHAALNAAERVSRQVGLNEKVKPASSGWVTPKGRDYRGPGGVCPGEDGNILRAGEAQTAGTDGHHRTLLSGDE